MEFTTGGDHGFLGGGDVGKFGCVKKKKILQLCTGHLFMYRQHGYNRETRRNLILVLKDNMDTTLMFFFEWNSLDAGISNKVENFLVQW